MSGHSKWNNIKRKKEKTDGAKAAVFTKFAREIAVAVKEGGGADPTTNGKLRDCIAKAFSALLKKQALTTKTTTKLSYTKATVPPALQLW